MAKNVKNNSGSMFMGYSMISGATDNIFFHRGPDAEGYIGWRDSQGTMNFETVLGHKITASFKDTNAGTNIEFKASNGLSFVQNVTNDDELMKFRANFRTLVCLLIAEYVNNSELAVEHLGSLLEALTPRFGDGFQREIWKMIDEHKTNNWILARTFFQQPSPALDNFRNASIYLNNINNEIVGQAEHSEMPGVLLEIKYPDTNKNNYILKLHDVTGTTSPEDVEYFLFSGKDLPPDFVYERIEKFEQEMRLKQSSAMGMK